MLRWYKYVQRFVVDEYECTQRSESDFKTHARKWIRINSIHGWYRQHSLQWIAPWNILELSIAFFCDKFPCALKQKTFVGSRWVASCFCSCFFFIDFDIRSIFCAGNACKYVLFSVTSLTTKSFYCAYGVVVCAPSDSYVSHQISMCRKCCPVKRNVNVNVNIKH